MSIYLRIDVDNCYSWRNLFTKALNKVCLNYPSVAIRSKMLGYQFFVEDLINKIEEVGIKAGWFFQPLTVSKKKVIEQLDAKGHTLAYHAVTTDTYEHFMNGKTSLERVFGKNVECMSKHGSGELKLNRFHTPEYDPDQLLEYSKKAGLKLFTGNDTNPELPERKEGGTKFLPGIYWINPSYRDTKKHNLQWLKDYSTANDVIVLVHPIRIAMDRTIASEFDRFLEADLDIQRFSKVY